MPTSKNIGHVTGYNTIPAQVDGTQATLLGDGVAYKGDYVVNMGTGEVYEVTAVDGNSYTVGASLGVITEIDDADYIPTSEKGAAGGVATLGDDGLVPSSQLPAYVSDIVEVDTFDDLPTEGEDDKIYITMDDNKTYRWGGTTYVEISASLALGETAETAFRGDYGKVAYDHSQETGNPHNTALADLIGDEAIGDTDTPVYYDGSDLTACDGVATTEYVDEQLKDIDVDEAVENYLLDKFDLTLNTDGDLIATIG